MRVRNFIQIARENPNKIYGGVGDVFWDPTHLYQSLPSKHGVYIWKNLGKIVERRQAATDRLNPNGLRVFEHYVVLDNGRVYMYTNPFYIPLQTSDLSSH